MNKYYRLVALAPLALTACWSTSSDNCYTTRCPLSPSYNILVVSNGAMVKNLTWSGPACDGASVGSRSTSLSNFDHFFEPAAFVYEIGPIIPGACDVQVELEDGDILQKSFIVTLQGCCGDYVATGNPWTLNAPSVDAG